VDGPVAIEADRIEWHAGIATAEGSVTVALGDSSLVGTRATWDGVTLVVEEGEYRRRDGTLAFDRAEVTPTPGVAVLVHGRATSGGAALTAERMSIADGRWTAEGATVTPCTCTDGARPALSFSAASITVIPAKVVILHGAVVRVFGVPVLPVPYYRVPLDPHRFRLLFPEVGWGSNGANAQIEGRGGVGPWTFQGGPAWRQDRGARAGLVVTGPGVDARGAIGWDSVAERVRGVGVTRGGEDSSVRAGWDVTVLSDPDYVADYAVDYVSRGVAWRDSRAVVAIGPERLDGWLPDDGTRGALLRERVAWEIGRGHAVGLTPRVGVAAVGPLDGLAPLAEVGLGARAAGSLGWLAVAGRGDVAARATYDLDDATWTGTAGEGTVVVPDIATGAGGWAGGLGTLGTGATGWADGLADGPLARWGAGGTGVGGAAAGELTVPVWSTLGPARIQWWPGVRAETRLGWSPDTAGLAVRAGPALRASTALADGGVGFDAALLQDGAGWRPAATIDVHLARLALRAQADPAVQAGEVRWMPGPVTVAVGTTHADPLWLAWGDTGVAVGRLRTGAGLSWDLGQRAFAGADARIGYDDGCAAALITARFAPDRALPDLGLAVTLRR
jgi:hypothetical protein